ncbi:hypothetical protein [Pseudooceanicola antarcticus]|uniref:hypothetical protein n=1 Tax=Pseudooceanicola antarcticus TaxID=1247613 RepID=UPI00117BD9D1|nr:hypothetical protein [Pseudooceanicola antarcticus]
MTRKSNAARAGDLQTKRATGDVPQQRQCLRCEASFWSEGFGERICRRCKGSNSWRNAVPAGPSSTRRR